jgi:predicted TIM-barrel fold metal-dependent hydrolase
MSFVGAGAIDCDVHPAVPGIKSLLPYLEPHWREQAVRRGIHDLESLAYPINSPLTSRPEWRPAQGKPGGDLARLRSDLLDGFGIGTAICNCLYGVQVLFSEDMGAAFARALNDWVRAEWLDREKRLRASIVVPVQSPELSVAEIERLAPDPRFVQVLLLVMGDMPLGKRAYWPIYEAAVRHGLPVGIHAGSSYRHPVTAVGWPSTYTEDYAAQSVAFQAQLASLICEGAFSKFPDLRVVLLESGFTWLPAFLWRLTKYWRGLRSEIPWVDRLPNEIVRDQVRLTIQPVDGPDDAAGMARLLEHLQSDDLLLFSTDYPHWQFEGEQAIPEGFSAALRRKIMFDNPRATYPRIAESVPA